MVFKLFAFEIEIKISQRPAAHFSPKKEQVDATDFVNRDYLRAMSYFLRN